MDRFAGHAWFPSGIASSLEPLFEVSIPYQFSLHTPHGTLRMIDVPDLDKSQGWSNLFQAIDEDDEFQIWGDARLFIAGDIEVLESYVTSHGVEAILKSADKSYVVLFDPLPKKSWRKRWSQIDNLGGALKCTGGVQSFGRDVIVLRPFIEDERCLSADDIDVELIRRIGDALGRFHTSMEVKAGPRMAKEWNARLKRLERISGSRTMWRAPYSVNTESIWAANRMNFNDWIQTGDEVCLDMLRIGCEPLGDIVDDTSRFPAIRDVELLHSEINELAFGEDAIALHEALFESWKRVIPSQWSSRDSLDANRGGTVIWRYDVELCRKLEAQANPDNASKKHDEWLSQVAAFQRKLFNRRTVPAMGLCALIILVFCAMFLDISALFRFALLVGGVLCRIISQVIYRGMSPLSPSTDWVS